METMPGKPSRAGAPVMQARQYLRKDGLGFEFPESFFASFRQLGVPYAGVLIIRILLFSVLH